MAIRKVREFIASSVTWRSRGRCTAGDACPRKGGVLTREHRSGDLLERVAKQLEQLDLEATCWPRRRRATVPRVVPIIGADRPSGAGAGLHGAFCRGLVVHGSLGAANN